MPFSLLLLLACTGSTDDTGDILDGGAQDGGANDGGLDDGGSTGAPAGCEEVGRDPVADPTAPAEGMDFAAAAVLDPATGEFTGTATLRGAKGDLPPVEATLTMAGPTDLVLVTQELTGGGGTDTGPSPGAPSPTECPPYYQATAAFTLATADGALAEAFSSTLTVFELSAGASAGLSLDVAALVGSYAPADFDPADWDQASLDVMLDSDPKSASWRGELQWSASKDLGDGVGKGLVGPAGSFEVARP